MFSKLSRKYKAPNPLDGIENASMANKPTPTSTMPFFGATSTPTPPSSSMFGGSGQSLFGQAKAPSSSTPFGNTSGMTNVTAQGFGVSNSSSKSPFGQSSGLTTPFGQSAGTPSTPFGQAATPSTPFGQSSTPVAPSTPFGQQTPSASGASPFVQSGVAPMSTPFGANNAPTSGAKFGGKTAREILVAFYQERNPAQLAKVDQVLAKYAGKEEQLLRNLAKKYNVNPRAFGLQSIPAQPPSQTIGGSAFGSSTPAFGQTSGFGQTTTGFGSVMSPQASTGGTFGQSFGSTTGTSSSSGFGSFANQNTGGFGSLSGNSPSAGFGSTGFATNSTSPFGAARR